MAVLLASLAGTPKYDLAILNGRVVGGDGNPWYRADVGIKGDRIVFIGPIAAQEARLTLDAGGCYVTPGFIDIHTHTDALIVQRPDVANYLLQGVTTVIGGNCGNSSYPLAKLFDRLQKQPPAVNFGALAGHGTLRRQVMGSRMDAPTADELKEMKRLLGEELRAGALGLSTGLIYPPGSYAKTEELIDLAGVLRAHDGLYASHIRGEGSGVKKAVAEALAIGEANHVRVEISHIKIADRNTWGQADQVTDLILKARELGLEVTTDQYPYLASSTSLASRIPAWAFEGGHGKFLARTADPEQFARMKAELIRRSLSRTDGSNPLKEAFVARCKDHPEYQGRNLEEILRLTGQEPTPDRAADLIIELAKTEKAMGIFHSMAEGDLIAFMRNPFNMVGSDGGIQEEAGEEVPHPRSFGTFPRVLATYALEKGILRLEEAVRKMTSLPAQTLRLVQRGLVKEGYFADLVIFDPRTLADRSTYKEPRQTPSGIRCVLVNGQVAAKDGRPTGALAGVVLHGKGRS
jgi:N-acyl-D-amino-acid deacylase